MFKKILLAILFTTLASLATAEDFTSPVGRWQTFNDDTQAPASLVKITNQNGVLVGEVLQLLPGAHFKPTDLCSKCPAPFKNKPIVGLQFLWGFVLDQNQTWENGQVLDPVSGHIYKGRLKVVDHGRKLELRGYWGPFWRTQTWVRL